MERTKRAPVIKGGAGRGIFKTQQNTPIKKPKTIPKRDFFIYSPAIY
jgi:hypothetical protein